MQLKCSVLPNEAEKSSEQEQLHFTSYKGRNTGVAGGRSYLNSSPALLLGGVVCVCVLLPPWPS